MKKLLSKTLVLLFLGTLSCKDQVPIKESCYLPGEKVKSSQPVSSEDEADTNKSESLACLIPQRSKSSNLETNITLQDFSAEKEIKLKKAISRVKIVINSIEFKSRVIGHQYQGKKTFVDNGGKTNEEIYNSILAGAEILKPEVDEEIDLDITLYYSRTSTVGYTYRDTSRIWMNDKFFSTFTLAKVAANIVHEWTHKLGYEHDAKRTVRRNFSVPYGVGTIIETLVDEMSNPVNKNNEKASLAKI